MDSTGVRSLAVVIACLFALAAGCGGPPGHDREMGGVFHGKSLNDPLHKCAGCHGDKLQGGSGPSCYQCHDHADHDVDHTGVKHRAGDSASCGSCHGPDNSGGLGPACSSCHTQ